MALYKIPLLALIGLIALAGLGAEAVAAAEPTPAEIKAARRLQKAVQIQAATRARLLVLENPAGCGASRFVAYRRSDVERNLVDEWYVASQLWADATLLRAVATPGGPRAPDGWDAGESACLLRKGLEFIDRLQDDDGGAYPRSDPNGMNITRETRYADDNALTGLALLAAADATPDPALRQRYLDLAREEARFLIESNLWDQTFGGGFWWNTDRGNTPEGKPAQTNVIATLFFARLHGVTGASTHRDWALRTMAWTDATLFNPSRNLYRWSIAYQDPERRKGGPALSERYFNYDQGIGIEAQLAISRLDGDQLRLVRARSIGQTLNTTFWSSEGGFNLEAGIEQVYTSYAAWASLGHLALYDLDGDPRWLQMARSNAAALKSKLRETDGGYAYRYYRCVDRIAPGCESGQVPSVVDHTRDTSAQAWMQHLQTAIAQRLAGRR